jgi:uridine kinase
MSFPKVKETLAMLRKRGYKLAQYTNSSTQYLNTVMSSLSLRDYYDYVECIEDNHLTKNELAKKIKEHFGVEAAIVGDRCHDIEAARENDCLAIGALYGYGEKEPEAADLTIKTFADLLTIFDRKLPIFEKIANDIQRQKQKDRALVVGVNGIDCSGKTTFAKALEGYLKTKGHPTQIIAIDDFLNPKTIRYSGSNPADNYYNKSFNTKKLIEKLLKPISEKINVAARLKSVDPKTDKYNVLKRYIINADTIVILEGVFIYKKDTAPYIDYKIYLDVPFGECLNRAIARDSAEIYTRYDAKYLPAQDKYIKECAPASQSDLVIDNANPEYPKSH